MQKGEVIIMKLVKKRTDESYYYEGDSIKEVFIEEIKQYHYKDEEEKLGHSRIMQKLGYEDSGQQKENLGTLMKPKMVWFGSYYKHERSEKN